MDEALRKEIDLFVEKNTESLKKDIARLVAVPSIEGEAAEGAPFGEGPRAALDKALEIARDLGLKTVDCEHHLGYAVIGEDSDKYLASICHVDVVPVGEGWDSDPWTVIEKEGYLIGRGVMDDKGPAVILLYALKFLQEKGVPLRYPFRAMMGANEETGMGDLEYYLEHYPEPLFCFSPDADFPLTNGEKGIVHGRIRSTCRMDKIVKIEGGHAVNAVPSLATAVVKAESLSPAERVETEELFKGLWKVTAHGVGGHASMPQGTVSAIGVLYDYLLANQVLSPEEEAFIRFAVQIPHAPDGSFVGCAADDGLFTPLTLVSGRVYEEDGHIVQSLDFRFPTNTNREALLTALREAAGSLAEVELGQAAEPFYKDPDCPELTACMAAYNEVTGEQAKPFTIGGGTYARHFKNAVAFGPEHPERPYPAFAGAIHGANEAARISDMLEALKVYIVTLLNLEELEY